MWALRRGVVLISDDDIAAAIEAAVNERGAGKTICPSEVARALAADWRELMPDIRRVAQGLDTIEVSQKGAPVDALLARGPIRFGLTKPQLPD